MGEGATYQECLFRHVLFPDCRMEMTVKSLISYRRWLYGKKSEINWDRLSLIYNEHLPQVYGVIFSQYINKCQCSFPGCPRSSHSRISLRNHLNRIHWQDMIHIIQENYMPYPPVRYEESRYTMAD